MALHKAGLQPWGRSHMFRDTHYGRREESPRRFPEEMEPWLSLFERPDFQLMSEGAELSSCEKILKFGHWRWHSAHDLVSPDAGKHHAISLRRQTGSDLWRGAAVGAGSWHKPIVGRFGPWIKR